MKCRRWVGVGVAVLLGFIASPVAAQDGVGFRFAYGWQDVGGDYGEVLDGHYDGEFTILYGFSSVRLGAGANFVSFAMDDIDDESWSQITGHFLLTYPFDLGPSVRGYVEGRLTFRRLRPEGDRYFNDTEELLGPFVASGNGFEGVVGVEVPFGPRWALDLSAGFGRFGTGEDLSSQGFGAIDSGSTWRVHAGITWFPTAVAP